MTVVHLPKGRRAKTARDRLERRKHVGKRWFFGVYSPADKIFTPFAGPFATRAEADAIAEECMRVADEKFPGVWACQWVTVAVLNGGLRGLVNDTLGIK